MTPFRYPDNETMSTMTATTKMDEQRISDAGKPLQNGHGCNKGEELQLEDANDNNNDEVGMCDESGGATRKKKKKRKKKEKGRERAVTRDRSDQCIRA